MDRREFLKQSGKGGLGGIVIANNLLISSCGLIGPNDNLVGPEIGDVVNDGYGDYVAVPAGEFEMGDNFGEGSLYELPVHTVMLDAHYIGKYEVTNGEYKKFIDDGGYTTEAYWGSGGYGDYGSQPRHWDDATLGDYSYNIFGGGISGNENYPVVGVSWYEAMVYCAWLSAKTGKTYRLPTEAEWEKAARGDNTLNQALGHQRRYAWGNDIDGSYANYLNSGDPNDNGLTEAGYYNGKTHGSFVTNNNASPYGAYDMTGNVWEWCYDWHSRSYYSSSPPSNPTGPSSASYRVIRGGSWSNVTSDMRAARRYVVFPTARPYYLGFRCLREP